MIMRTEFDPEGALRGRQGLTCAVWLDSTSENQGRGDGFQTGASLKEVDCSKGSPETEGIVLRPTLRSAWPRGIMSLFSSFNVSVLMLGLGIQPQATPSPAPVTELGAVRTNGHTFDARLLR